MKEWIARILLAAAGLLPWHSLLAADELQVWIRASTESRKTYDAMAEAFRARTGIRIEYFNTVTDFEQRLARAAAGRSLPDLVFDDAAYLGQFQAMGIVAEIDRPRLKGEADLIDIAWESARAGDGKYYAVPTSAQAFALFALDHAGLDLLEINSASPAGAGGYSLQLFVAGDVNGDGQVDGRDGQLLAAALGSVQGDPNYVAAADLDQRGLPESLEDIGDAPNTETDDQNAHHHGHNGLAEPV